MADGDAFYAAIVLTILVMAVVVRVLSVFSERRTVIAAPLAAIEQERARLIQERSARVRFKAKRTDIDPALQKATTASLLAAVGWF